MVEEEKENLIENESVEMDDDEGGGEKREQTCGDRTKAAGDEEVGGAGHWRRSDSKWRKKGGMTGEQWENCT